MYLYAKMSAIKYWLRITLNAPNTLVTEAYHLQRNLAVQNVECWGSNMKLLLSDSGFSEMWQQDGPLHITKTTTQHMKQQIFDKHIDVWQNLLAAAKNYRSGSGVQGKKLRTYAKFKTRFTLEPYLNSDNKHISLLTKIRISAHAYLNIESGRHSRTPLEARICKECECIDDEFHLFILCKKFSDARAILFKCLSANVANFNTLSSYEKFLMLINPQTIEIANIVANFLGKCFPDNNNRR